MEGTYPLPEAQLDRFFFKVLVRFPNEADLSEILRRTTSSMTIDVERAATGESILRMGHLAREVPIASSVSDYVVRLVMASHPDNARSTPTVRRYCRRQSGSSP
jgi:MoxR-like ATPase